MDGDSTTVSELDYLRGKKNTIPGTGADGKGRIEVTVVADLILVHTSFAHIRRER